jgi:hypothetical protein
MCDYCDCRSHPAIGSLSADHEVLLGLLGDLRRATAVPDRTAAAVCIEGLRHRLGDHAAREERGVFTELRRAGVDGAYVDWFERDHVRIHELLDAGDREGDDELIELLADHILREESDLFPVAHQVLAPHQWDAVDAVHAVQPDPQPLGAPT